MDLFEKGCTTMGKLAQLNVAFILETISALRKLAVGIFAFICASIIIIIVLIWHEDYVQRRDEPEPDSEPIRTAPDGLKLGNANDNRNSGPHDAVATTVNPSTPNPLLLPIASTTPTGTPPDFKVPLLTPSSPSTLSSAPNLQSSHFTGDFLSTNFRNSPSAMAPFSPEFDKSGSSEEFDCETWKDENLEYERIEEKVDRIQNDMGLLD